MLDLWMLLVALAVGLAACSRDPIAAPCPDVAPGELAISEIRGPQTGADALGQWIEIYNASGHTVELSGLALRMRKLDGSGDLRILVRAERQVAAQGYAVLGRFAEGAEPSYVTYGFLDDFSSNLYPSGALDLESCGELIDRAVYRSLPAKGTLSLDGTSWCTDASGDGGGTPKERNNPCGP